MKLRLWAENLGHAQTESVPGRPLLAPAFTLVLALFAGLFAAGCKTPQGQILLEHENFQQEKCIDDLRDQLEDTRSDLDQCRRENAALRRQTGGTASSPSSESPGFVSPPTISGGTSSAPAFSPPAIDRGTEAPPAYPTAPPPQSLPPSTPPSQRNSSQDRSTSTNDAAPLDHSGPDGGVSASSYEEEEPPNQSQSAERISIIRLLTNGHQFGGHVPIRFASSEPYGDNGVQAAFSARDAENRAVAVRGSVSMVVIDPELSGPAARVARWDFSPQETASHYRQTLFGNAYRFDLLWPHEAPQHERLKLFIRVTMRDGRRLEAHQTIYVKLGSQMPAGDDSNVVDADTPAPPDGTTAIETTSPPQTLPIAISSTPSASPPPAPAPSVSASSDMGQYEADDPAPAELTQLPSSSGNIAQSDATWRPYR